MNERPLEESIRALLRSAAPRELPPHLVDRVLAIPTAVVIRARRPRLQWGYGGAFAALVALSVMVSAVLIAPRTASLFGDATLASKPSPTAAAGSSNSGPVTICGDVPDWYKGVFVPFLACDEAISAAVGSLPKEHPEIAQIEFGFGDYCGPSAACPTGIDLMNGYVVVSYATGPRTLISVRDVSAQPGVSVTSTELLP